MDEPNWKELAEQYKRERDALQAANEERMRSKQLLLEAMVRPDYIEPDFNALDWDEIKSSIGKNPQLGDMLADMRREFGMSP